MVPFIVPQEITNLHRLSTILRARNEERYADEILALMLPQTIVEKLKKAGDADARFAASFPETSVLFGAGMAGGGTPREISMHVFRGSFLPL